MASGLTAYNELGDAVRKTIVLDKLHPDDSTKNRITERFLLYQIGEDGVSNMRTEYQAMYILMIIQRILTMTIVQYIILKKIKNIGKMLQKSSNRMLQTTD